MKKIIKVISLFLIIVVFGEVSYASEYLNKSAFLNGQMTLLLPKTTCIPLITPRRAPTPGHQS